MSEWAASKRGIGGSCHAGPSARAIAISRSGETECASSNGSACSRSRASSSRCFRRQSWTDPRTDERLPRANGGAYSSPFSRPQAIWTYAQEKLARLELQDRTLLDILFERYLDSVEALLKEGLIKRYRSVSRDRRAVKGRIDHIDNLRRNLCHAERISTVASEYDRFNLPNRVLKAAVDTAARFAPTFYSRSRARSVAFEILGLASGSDQA